MIKVILCIADMIPDDLIEKARQIFDTNEFEEGTATAGWHAKLVKRNLQLTAQQPAVQSLRREFLSHIARHRVITGAALPKRFRPLLFNRYITGMAYGSHVDDAIMGQSPQGGEAGRADISFTVFLSAPESHDGGELVIESTSGEQVYKLQPGQAVLYPATSLHRVTEVTRGVRDAAVGWIQSFVRDAGQRELLFELDNVRRAIFRRDGKCPEFDSLSHIYSNLLRRWSEV